MCIIKKEITVIQITRKIIIDKAIWILTFDKIEVILVLDTGTIQIVITDKHERITVMIDVIV